MEKRRAHVHAPRLIILTEQGESIWPQIRNCEAAAVQRLGDLARRAVQALCLITSFWLAAPVLANEFGDAKRGEAVYSQCATCHQVGKKAESGIGPALNNIFHRPVADVPHFKYSESLARLRSSGMRWTFDQLDAYIENPRALASQTSMGFAGLASKQDRADLLAYLRLFSGNPADLPESAPTSSVSEVSLPADVLALEGDRAYGEYLASECLTCHQMQGSSKGVPSITGWPQKQFVVAMHAYKQKKRPNAIMQMMAGRLADEEIAALAAYFASP